MPKRRRQGDAANLTVTARRPIESPTGQQRVALPASVISLLHFQDGVSIALVTYAWSIHQSHSRRCLVIYGP